MPFDRQDLYRKGMRAFLVLLVLANVGLAILYTQSDHVDSAATSIRASTGDRTLTAGPARPSSASSGTATRGDQPAPEVPSPPDGPAPPKAVVPGADTAPTPPPALGDDPGKTQPVVSFLGDSYVTGAPGSPAERSFAGHAAKAGRWDSTVHGGTAVGFVETASGSLADHVTEVAADDPSLVVVVSGDADRGEDASDVAAAATQTLRSLRAALPDTPVIAIGPFSDAVHPSADVLARRDAIRMAAAEVPGVTFIDPVEEEWLRGSHDLVSNGGRLTAEGQQSHSVRFRQTLERLELPAPFGAS